MILVTGATGFVGAAVARFLLNKKEKVRVLARPGSDRRNLEGLDVDIVEGDLLDRASLDRAAKGCRGLFHVAADYRLWTPKPTDMFKANVGGTRNMLLAAAEAGVKRIVYTSSVATLGIPAGMPCGDEESPVAFEDMIGAYKQSKFLAEEEVRALVANQGIPAVIVNPAAPIGPGDIKPTPTGRMIVEAAAGRIPAYVDTGLNIVHVDDVARGHWLAYEKGKVGERYILGGENMTLRDILTVVAELNKCRPPRIRLPHNVVLPLAFLAESWVRMRGKGEPFATVDGVRMSKKRMFFSSSKAIRELGYETRPVRDAFVDSVDWFRAKGYVG